MDRRQYVQRHYDAVHMKTQHERAKGPLFQLKQFHNQVKRDLLEEYADCAGKLLDICCGRGGDLHKWIRCGIQRVVAVDISSLELREARARYKVRQSPYLATTCDFRCEDVTQRTWEVNEYDVISAMFCMHYFCSSRETLQTVLQGIARCLKPGGFFIGCMPDGSKVEEYVASKASSQYLSIQPLASFSSSSAFGREYLFALEDTVTESSASSGGSLEYLVDVNVFVDMACDAGLHLVEKTPMVHPSLDYPGKEASKLFLAFAFKKI